MVHKTKPEATPEPAPELAPELISLEDSMLTDLIGEVPDETEEKEEAIPVADYELVLTSKVTSTEQPMAPQIRFAEDIMPAKSTSPKKKGGGKKDKEQKDSGAKTKKARPKRVSYLEEDDEYEE